MNRIDTLARLGRFFFALSLVAFGIQNFVYKGFVTGLELTPEWIPGHTFWAYFMGAVLLAGGVSIAIDKKAPLAAALLSILYFASLLLVRVPKIPLMYDVSGRTVIFETLTICCGALVLAGTRRSGRTGFRALDNAVDRSAAPARILLGISMIVFGIDHFEVVRFIASLIPAWIPGALFWAWFTGFAFIVAGVSVITRWRMRLAAALLGLMFFLWVVLLHAPRVAANPHNGDEWNSAFIALTICGIGWILAGVPAKESHSNTTW
jgi:uncharacterized membrane protein YphA (DoxX/SURF4 family)